eukprot:8811938-Pyramimonas_sp.AAC.1
MSVRVPRLVPLLEPSWEPLRPSWRPLGLSWGPLGPFWALLEASWAVLERSWKPLGPSWSAGKPERRERPKPSTTQGKSLISASEDPLWRDIPSSSTGN